MNSSFPVWWEHYDASLSAINPRVQVTSIPARYSILITFLYDHYFQALLLLFVLLSFHRAISTRHTVPQEIPWTGVDGRTFLPRTRATLRSVLRNKQHLEEGFQKFSRRGIPFVLPNLLTGPDVILPRSHIQWLLDQPSCILSQAEVNRYFLEADYTMLHPNIVRDTVHERVIRAHLQKQLEYLTGDIMEELTLHLDKSWGLNTADWKTVPVFGSMADVLYRTINRVLVGLPLCRDENYLYHNSRVFQHCLFVAGIINLLPTLLKPYRILAPFITIFDKYHYWHCARKVEPLIRSRMGFLKCSDELKLEDKIPNDYIQWAINDTMDHPDPYERSPQMISKRLAVLQFAAIITSIITITNTLLDLASSSSFNVYWTKLREEVERILAEENGTWTHGGIARMVRMDSTIKESLRMGGVVSRGLMKKVVVANGVKLPDGTHLPYGVQVGVSSYTTQRDESIYPDPNSFNAFRFCTASVTSSDDRRSTSRLQATSAPARDMYAPFVKTTETFMAFSHGRHACPGRFFAADQLKLVLAYLVLNYDIEPIPSREPHLWFVNSIAPPMKATLRVKRRMGTA